MRFDIYLNESFEKKIFILIDNFMNDNSITMNDIISGDATFKLVDYFRDTLGLSSIDIFSNVTSNVITGKSSTTKVGNVNYRTIKVSVPSVPPKEMASKEFKLSVLSTLFHEINHQMANVSPHKHFSGNYVQGDPQSAWSFTEYFLQDEERYSKAISLAMTALNNKVDIFDLIKSIRTTSMSIKDLEGLNKALNDYRDKFVGMSEYSIANLRDIILVSFFIYNMNLISRDKEIKRKMRNKFESYLKNLEKSYKGFKFYFEKYGL